MAPWVTLVGSQRRIVNITNFIVLFYSNRHAVRIRISMWSTCMYCSVQYSTVQYCTVLHYKAQEQITSQGSQALNVQHCSHPLISCSDTNSALIATKLIPASYHHIITLVVKCKTQRFIQITTLHLALILSEVDFVQIFN